MPQFLTIPLEGDDTKVEGDDWLDDLGFDDNDVNKAQIVTFTDDGDITGTLQIKKFGKGTSDPPGQGPGGNDEFIFDLSTFDDDFHIELKSLDTLDIFRFQNATSITSPDGVNYTITYIGSDSALHTITIDADANPGSVVQVVCFARGTMIDTPYGERAVEDLDIGEDVICGDGLARPIRWIGRRRLGADVLRANPALKPVCIHRHAFGRDGPHSDLFVSPQHRILLRSPTAELLFGEGDVLVAAKHLVNDRSIVKQSLACEVEYYHFMLDGHHTVFANGLAAETLFLGDVASRSLGAEARHEIFEIFPELLTDLSAAGETCHMALLGHQCAVLSAASPGV